jgi:hypothetical protein
MLAIEFTYHEQFVPVHAYQDGTVYHSFINIPVGPSGA